MKPLLLRLRYIFFQDVSMVLTECNIFKFENCLITTHCLLKGVKLNTILNIFQVVSGTCFLYSFWPSALTHRIIGVFLVAEKYVIPIIILIYCYGRIIWVLSKRAESNLDNTGDQGDKFQLAKKNTIKTFLIVSICFFLCWFNSQLAYLLYNLGYNISLADTYNSVSTVIAFVNCTINPFIYLIKYRDYQMALKSFCSCFFSKNNEQKSPHQEVRSSSVVSSEVITAS